MERLDRIRTRAVADLGSLNWSGLQSSAKGFAGIAFDLALQTGADFFADKYRNGTLAWAAAEIALSGDDGTAASMA